VEEQVLDCFQENIVPFLLEIRGHPGFCGEIRRLRQGFDPTFVFLPEPQGWKPHILILVMVPPSQNLNIDIAAISGICG